MIAITATEFAKKFGFYKEKAQREPVAITSHGHPSGYFLSAHEFAEYQRLKSMARKVYHVSELPEDLAAAISQATMAPEHAHLNSLLDD